MTIFVDYMMKRTLLVGVLCALGAWMVAMQSAEAGRIPDNYVPKPDAPRPPTATWGLVKVEAVEVCMPAGERAYLDRLRCEDGSEPSVQRVGNAGYRNDPPESMGQEEQMAYMDANRKLNPGEVDIHIVDIYSVTCGKQEPIQVFLDMYHCPQAEFGFAPEGLVFK